VGPKNPSKTWGGHPPSTHGGHHEFGLDLKLEQSKFKKIQKNGKSAHGVMICDVVPRKNTKHGIPWFERKSLHKKWHQAGVNLAFYPSDHGLCKFYSKNSNIDLIFYKDVHLSKSYNFLNCGFLTCHKKMDFLFY
jgi:hypothetical protein